MKKSVTCSRTYGKATSLLTDLRVAENLRRGRLAASVVTVFVTPTASRKGHSTTTPGRTLWPTRQTHGLLRYALNALERSYKQEFKYQKAGVMLNSLSPVD